MRAFDAGLCLFDCKLLGRPYRSVAKSLRSLRDLCAQWSPIDVDARRQVREAASSDGFASPEV